MFHRSTGHEKENKQEAAIEAARDPTSSTTALDAHKTIIEESRKAGAATYTFDPDASPEAKSARAGADVAPDFHHRRKPVALGVVSDLGGSSGAQYDLPTPTTAGAIESPITPTTPSSTINGHLLHGGEDEKYKKTGWAPRFGYGKMTEDEANESLIDQTTWMEEKLGEQFFGDWYHNAAVIIFACLASWVIAVVGGGLGWVLLVMAFCGTYYRTSIRRVRRNFRDDVHREMQLRRLETDTESLEWINSFLVKFWPIYQPVLASTIIAAVDQVLSSTTPAFLDSMRLKTFTLGTKPPRLEHVKTYPKVEDDIVVMDWKFSFTPNDTMDMTARQLKDKINPKVVLEIRIGKGIVSKALDVIVEDFAFSGIARVKVKLQVPFPHIEKVEFCFMAKPDIDYKCKPLGGEHFGFDINFIPGLEGFIKEQIHDNLGPIMYAPNVFPIEIAKMLAGNAVDQAIGVLAVTMHGAHGLKNPDSGTPDPYAIVCLNGREELARTKTVKHNSDPRWNETKFVILTSLTDMLTLQVWDYNEYRKDKELGVASFSLERLEDYAEHENLQLEVIANGKPRGVMQADIRFFPILTGVKREDGTEEPVPESNTGIAKLTIEQAKELDSSISMVGQLSPYAILLLNNQEIQRTKTYKRTNAPVFEEGSKEFLVTDRQSARLGVVLKDERELGTHPLLGAYQIKLDDMLKMMGQGKEWYNLSNVKSGRVKLTLQWKPIALRGVEGSSGGYVNPIGVMRLHFKSAKDLKNVEAMGKSDPYVRIMLSGVEKAKTVTIRNNLNPEWDEVLYVPVHSGREQLTLECMDYQNVGKDRSLGYVELSLHDYVREDDNGEYMTHNTKKLQSLPLRMLRGGNKGTLNFTASFFPTVSVIDPEEEEAEKRDLEEAQKTGRPRAISRASSRAHSRQDSTSTAEKRLSAVSITEGRKSLEQAARVNQAEKTEKDEKEQKALADSEMAEEAGNAPEVPSIRLNPEDLAAYNTGIIVFRIISAELARLNCHLEVVMDDYVFPAYHSSKAKSYHHEFGETGDAVVRELDMSKITLRLMERKDKKGEGDAEENAVAKLTGDTLQVLQSCLYQPRELVLKGAEASVNKVKVSMKYLPLKMQLDPSESLNNMGTLRVDVLDASDLPSADRNGYSDPYCKFELNGESVHKTKVQKKTLNPAWNEFFEVPIPSRTAAKFSCRVMDWDFGDKADFLGDCQINLTELEPMVSKELRLVLNGKSGVLRLRMLFKSSYVQRTRQGSSTFSGTIGPAGKVIGAPVKGVGMVGSGVVKGATFLGSKFRSGSGRHGTGTGTMHSNASSQDFVAEDLAQPGNQVFDAREPSLSLTESQIEAAPLQPKKSILTGPDGTPVKGENGTAAGGALSTPLQPFAPSSHSRSASLASTSRASAAPGSARGDSGLATFTVVSASGFPAGTKLQVSIKPAGKHHVLRTKAVKAPAGEVSFAEQANGDATARVQTTADAQFIIKVVDDKFIGSDELGEAPLFVNDSGSGGERAVKVGAGQVVVKSSFAAAFESRSGADGAAPDSPLHAKRRSLLSRGRDRTAPAAAANDHPENASSS